MSQVSDEQPAEELDETLPPARVRATTERLAGWGRRLSSVVVWFAVAGSAVAAGAAWRAMPPAPAIVVTLLVCVPSAAALVLRSRLEWLLRAMPTALTELRTLATDRQTASAGDDPEVRALRVRVQALQRQLVGTERRSLFTLLRLIKLVRSPATQALQLARGSVSGSDRVHTTAQVVDRSAGLPVLAVGATAGSALVWLVAAILLVVGSF